MPKNQSDQSDDDSQQQQKFVYKKPQIFRIDKFKPSKKIIINLSTTQYPVLSDVAQQLNWKIQYSMVAGDWDIYWTDIPIDTDTLIKMHLFQKINYYPGIHTLARKNLLGMNLMQMKQRFPQQYSFFPMTWMLPQQYVEFRQYYQTKKEGKTRTYIVKPQADCQGRGIFLTRNIQDLQNGKHYVVQRYVAKPYLIQGLKFDMRIYVLIAGTNPLRLYIYEDGLARFATQKYVEPTNQNLQQQYMHLTNYAINKKNPKFIFNNSSTNMGTGHKRSLKCTYQQMRKKGVNVQVLKEKINDLIIKTIICGLPLLSHQYKCCQPEDYSNSMCFHVLGFDVMMDSKEQPILIQVNHTPSYATDTPLDYKIKFNLIKDTMKLMHITSKRKAQLFTKAKQSNQARLHSKKRPILDGKQRQVKIQQQQQLRDQYQKKHLGGYTKIFPPVQASRHSHYNTLIDGAYKMHYSQNTPIRIKLQQAQKKKQLEEDMKQIKQMEEKGIQGKTKAKVKDIDTNDFSLKRNNTTNITAKQLQDINQRNVKSVRGKNQDNSQTNNNNQNNPQQDQNLNQTNINQDVNNFILNRSQCFVDISDSTPIQIVSSSEAKISLSQSTSGTKNQDDKFQQRPLLNRSHLYRLFSSDKVDAQKNVRSKALNSIQKELVKNESLQIKTSQKFLHISDQTHVTNQQMRIQFSANTQKMRVINRLRKQSRQDQLPSIKDSQLSQLLLCQSSQNNQKASPSQNKILSCLIKQSKQLKRPKDNLTEIKIKNIQITRLLARKINFSISKVGNIANNIGNIGNNSNICKDFNLQCGNFLPGGFVVPKTYQLNMHANQKLQDNQNIYQYINKKAKPNIQPFF